MGDAPRNRPNINEVLVCGWIQLSHAGVKCRSFVNGAEKIAGSLTDWFSGRRCLVQSATNTAHDLFPRSLHLTCNYRKACSEIPTPEQWHNAMNSSFDRGTRGLDCYGAAAGMEATC